MKTLTWATRVAAEDHGRMMRRELQDATALHTIVSCYEAILEGAATPFDVDVIETMSFGWHDGTLDDRIRVAQHEPIARRAAELKLFTWGRGNRRKNKLPRLSA